MEVRDLQQRMRFLQEQLAPVTRQREYQEKEIQRLNKVGARAQPLPGKCLMFSNLFLSNPKLTMSSSLPRQQLVSDALPRPSALPGMGFGGGVSSPSSSCPVIPNSHAHGPPEMSQAQPLALTLIPPLPL